MKRTIDDLIAAAGIETADGAETKKANVAPHKHFWGCLPSSGDIPDSANTTIVTECGLKFVGEWKNNSPVAGILTTEDGITFEGKFINGLSHVKGRSIRPTSVIYEGNFIIGKLHGFGTKIVPKWESYRGQFANNLYHGKGELKSICGTYKGQFSNGLIHGRGIFEYNDGTIVDGHFSNGMKHGICTIKYTNGGSYRGNFSCDKKHGTGVDTYPDGTTVARKFSSGEEIN